MKAGRTITKDKRRKEEERSKHRTCKEGKKEERNERSMEEIKKKYKESKKFKEL